MQILFPFTPVEIPGAFPDAPEVESQYGAAGAHQTLRPLIHRLRVHRPAVGRQRVREDDNGARRAAARLVEQRFEWTGRTGQIMNGWHR